MDSTACVHYYKDHGYSVSGLFIDYGQPATNQEESSATNVARYYGIELDIARFHLPFDFGPGEIKGRNALLALTALMVNPSLRGVIALGIHAGTPYYDCTDLFLRDIGALIHQYTDGVCTIDAPFLSWNKGMIYSYCVVNDVPVNLTYSCEVGSLPPCGECPSCKDRQALSVS